MSRDRLSEMLQVMAESENDNAVNDDPDRISKTRELYESFTAKSEPFKPGDFIVWKDGLRNKRGGGPFIVVEVLDMPRYDVKAEAGSAYFHEPLNIVAGEITDDGRFICYHYDSRRFTLYEGETVN